MGRAKGVFWPIEKSDDANLCGPSKQEPEMNSDESKAVLLLLNNIIVSHVDIKLSPKAG